MGICTENRKAEWIPDSFKALQKLEGMDAKEGEEFVNLQHSVEYAREAHRKLVETPNRLTQEPAFTTSKWRKGGVQVDKRGITNQTIDYIFYTSKDFECTRVLDITKEPIEPLLMPGWRYPSDHFMICADPMFSPAP